MDFDLNDEQRLLKDSVDGLTSKRYAEIKTRMGYVKEPKGYSAAVWTEFAELGLLAIPFAEADGGLGQGPVETMLVMEAFGRALAVDPYLATVVLGGGVLRHAGSAAQKQAILPGVMAGTTTLALANLEAEARYDLAHTATTAKSDGRGGYVLEGQKCVVLNGDSADKLIVTARISGDKKAADGIGLFLVDGAAAGVSRRGYPTQDGLRAGDIALAGVEVGPGDVIGTAGKGFPVLERVVHEAIAALASEAVGAMEALHQMTVEYLKTRKQFGVAIGSFQVLQHRCVDMLTSLEQARSMAYFATMMVTEENPVERRKAMAAVKVQIGRSARHIGQEATQMHGGIGMTMEYKGGHYFKRLTMIDILFGPADHHLRELARAGGLGSAAA
ncbi:MAG: acyl-CoA dehydrogenase family protein [Hyphomicrobium sp.]